MPLDDPLIPAPELLFDGSNNAEQFASVGEGFTRVILIDRGRLLPHERVLDIGSGNGQKARVLTQHLSPIGRYVGIDIVRAGVDWCRERYAPYPNFSFQHADIRNVHYNPDGAHEDRDYRLPFEDGGFDMVFLSSVFTHMLPAGVARSVQEISRVLAPGGRCVATAFILNADSLRRLDRGEARIRLTHREGGYRLLDAVDKTMGVGHPEAWLRDQFADAGLFVAEMTFGTWAGGKDIFGGLQDVVFAVKE